MDEISENPGASKALSTVSLPSLGQVRRVHNDGVLMLDHHYNMREVELKHQIMENRLKRLNDEQARAIKNQRMAEQKAQDMLEARSRHYTDMMAKIKLYQERNTL